jgi:hypothetical protein
VSTEDHVFLSARECLLHANTCEFMAQTFADAGLRATMTEIAAQWRQLAADAEARSKTC